MDLLKTYTKAQLQQFYDAGQTVLLAYRSVYSLQHSKNLDGSFYASPVRRVVSGLPFTKKGRHQFVTPAYYQKLQSIAE